MAYHKEQRVAILVDFPNLCTSAKQTEGSKINANCFHDQVGERQEIRALAYIAGGNYTQRFQHALKKLGFEVKLLPNGDRKMDCDVMITVEAIALSDKVDAVILGSGDGDFVPLVKYLQAKGVRVEVMAVESTAAFDLIQAADEFIAINGAMTYK